MSEFRFDRSLRERWRETDDGWRFTLPDGWLQGRTVFGGLTTAAALGLASRRLEADWIPRTLNVQFLRPTVAGEVAGHFTVHRAGKGTTFAEVRLEQGGATTLIAQIVCVRPRASTADVVAAPFRGGKPPDDAAELPYLPGITPEFTRHLAFRWADGTFPFSSHDRASLTGYCRMRVPFGDVEGMLALIDGWPCPTLSTLKAPAFASTATWTVHLIEIPTATDGWFGYEYDTVVGQHGQHTAVGRLFAPDGRLVAWSEQLVTVFA